MQYLKPLITVIILFSLIKTSLCQVVINEIQSSNASTILDFSDFQDHSDWIELYNLSNLDIEIGGWYLTDNTNKPQKWQIPELTVIPAKGYYFVWADGNNIKYNSGYQHTNFKLSKDGEEVALYNSDNELIDYFEFGYLFTDVSYGRINDGSDTLVFFGEPTPDQANGNIYSTSQAFASPPEFNTEGGFFNSNISVVINKEKVGQVIRYTTDGSHPNNSSNIYTGSISFDTSTIIRTRIYEQGLLPSPIITQSYFFNVEQNKLPTVSITAKPNNLWGAEGIYSRSLKGCEIPASFEFFDSAGVRQVGQMCDLRLSGQASSAAPQKSMTVSAKGKYGTDFFEYPFFDNRAYKTYKDVYLRNSGTPDNVYTMFRDGMTHNLIINTTDIDCQAYQPSKLFINGQYWGIINLRERITPDYLNNLHNVNTDNVNIVEFEFGTHADEGNDYDYDNMLEFLRTNILTNQDNYNYIDSKLDIDEFIDYQIAQIFIDNIDWVDRNIKVWNENTYNSKWRYLFFDTDVSFGTLWESLDMYSSYYHNNLAEALVEQNGSTYLFRSLIENAEFKNEFISRFSTYMNTFFDSTNTLNIIDSLYLNIYDEMPNHINRWDNYYWSHNGLPIADMNDWNTEVNIMREFARKRVEYQRQHIIDYFDLDGMDSLLVSVSNNKAGKLFIQNCFITDSAAGGLYFLNTQLKIKAVPNLGYSFVGWDNNDNTNTDTTLAFTGRTILKANFTAKSIHVIPDTIRINTTLLSQNSPYYTNSNIVVLPNVTLTCEPGVNIMMKKGSSVFVYGNIDFLGTSESNITIKPNDENGAAKWGGICFESGTNTSTINHVNLINATKTNFQNYFSCISSYNTNINIEGVVIESNSQPYYSEYGEISIKNSYLHSDVASDLINIKYASSALVEGCNLIGNETVDADAIDYDNLANGIIRNNKITGFIGYNSDAIDLGENAKNILIESNFISQIADKGISIGQASTANVKNNIITNCLQGLGIKDSNSYATIDKNTFYANNVAIACFEKNYNKGGGSASVKNCIFAESIESTFFIDQYSNISATYSCSNTDSLTGTGNIFAEPEFKNHMIFNFELASTSPCIDSGDPSSPLDTDGTLTDMGAEFIYSSNNLNTVIINEINFNSGDDDTYDWVELYNTSNNEINLAGWSFMDEKSDHVFTLPDGIKMEPDSYFVIYQNDSAFHSHHLKVSNSFGNFDFGLSNGSETLRLFDNSLNIVNSVSYTDSLPWPTNNDGNGNTLELISEDMDNSKPENWRSSPYSLGTPGETNNPETKPNYTLVNLGGCTGTVILKNTTQTKHDSCLWDFGDGTFSNENSIEHTYLEAGQYQVKLNIYSFYGNETVSFEVGFNAVNQVPIAYNDSSCQHTSLTLTTETTGTCQWYNNHDDVEPFHAGNTFTTPTLGRTKTYWVGNNENNCESKRVPISAIIYNDPLAYYKTTLDKNHLTLKNASLNALSYLWDFGDGNQSTDFEPKHTYNQTGEYQVTLYAYNDYCGTSDNRSYTIVVNEIDVGIVQKETEFVLYPNPANSVLNIAINEEINAPAQLMIYNIYGKLEKTCYINSSNNQQIILSGLNKGFYLVVLKTKDEKYTQQLVVN